MMEEPEYKVFRYVKSFENGVSVKELLESFNRLNIPEKETKKNISKLVNYGCLKINRDLRLFVKNDIIAKSNYRYAKWCESRLGEDHDIRT